MNLKKFLSATTFLLCSLLFVTSCSIKREVSKLKEEITRIEKLQEEQLMKDSLSVVSELHDEKSFFSDHRDLSSELTFDNSIIERWEYDSANGGGAKLQSYTKMTFDKRAERKKEAEQKDVGTALNFSEVELQDVGTASRKMESELQDVKRDTIRTRADWTKFLWLIPLLLLLLVILYSFRRGNK